MDAPRSAANPRARRSAALALVIALATACGGAATDHGVTDPRVPHGQQVVPGTTEGEPGVDASPSGGSPELASAPTTGAPAGGTTSTSTAAPAPGPAPAGEPAHAPPTSSAPPTREATSEPTGEPTSRPTEQPSARPSPTASAPSAPQPRFIGCAAVDAFLDRTRAARTQAAARDQDGDDYARLPRSGPSEAYRYDRDANTGGGAAPLRWENGDLRRSANHSYGKARSWRVDDAYRESAAALVDRYGTDAAGLVAFQDASARNRCQTTTDVYEVPGIPGAIGQAHHEPAANGYQARWYDTVAYGVDGGLNHVVALSSVDGPTDRTTLVRWAAQAYQQGG